MVYPSSSTDLKKSVKIKMRTSLQNGKLKNAQFTAVRQCVQRIHPLCNMNIVCVCIYECVYERRTKLQTTRNGHGQSEGSPIN